MSFRYNNWPCKGYIEIIDTIFSSKVPLLFFFLLYMGLLFWIKQHFLLLFDIAHQIELTIIFNL
ncbi:hypothetical protein BHC54_01955 [Snodgrassella alvi]|uniref:Uncharacterized protein n=1 Tax=Snodgrassella alvi TaxID=1196083 RepID=A0A2N9X9K9_9NEIS|nr:hypothetical protein BHC54_01955 [Snodgrassella alvi]